MFELSISCFAPSSSVSARPHLHSVKRWYCGQRLVRFIELYLRKGPNLHMTFARQLELSTTGGQSSYNLLAAGIPNSKFHQISFSFPTPNHASNYPLVTYRSNANQLKWQAVATTNVRCAINIATKEKGSLYTLSIC